MEKAITKAIEKLLGGKAEDGNQIASQPLKFTSLAAFGSSLAALAAIAIAVIRLFGDQHFSNTQLIAGVVLIGASVLGFAIASAGDAIARAYSAAWVVPKKGNVDAHPALADVASALRSGWVVSAVEGDRGRPEHPALADVAEAMKEAWVADLDGSHPGHPALLDVARALGPITSGRARSVHLTLANGNEVALNDDQALELEEFIIEKWGPHAIN